VKAKEAGEVMTEEEWLSATDPEPMVEVASRDASDRKLRLFAVSCCLQVLPLRTDERRRNAVVVAERHADGLATDNELKEAQYTAYKVHPRRKAKPICRMSPQLQALVWLLSPTAAVAARKVFGWTTSVKRVTRKRQCDSLRCIFGNPFRFITINDTLRTPSVTALAQATYLERYLPAGTFDPDRLSVLADALEDAGCTDATILDHLRGPGPHVRGCFVIDALLGKS
jgi:hypothetical protein